MKSDHQSLVLCVDNAGCPASLQIRKVYPSLIDAKAAEHGMIRVVDESGEDYLYPQDCFVRIEPRQCATRALRKAT